MIGGDQVAFLAIAAVLISSALASVLARRTFHAVMFLGAVLVTMGALFIVLGSSLLGVIQVLVYVGGILTLFIFAVMFVTGDDEEDVRPAKRALPAWVHLAGLALAAVLFFKLALGSIQFMAAALGAGFSSIVAVLLLLVVLVLGLVVFVVTWVPLAAFLWALYQRRWSLALGIFVSLLLFNLMLLLTLQTTWAPSVADGSGANDLTNLTDALFGNDVIAFEVLGVLLTAAMIGALVIARPMEAQSDESRYSHPTAEQVAQADRVSDPKHAVMSGPSSPLEASK